MRRLLTLTSERQLPGVFSHQLLESLQRNYLAKSSMNCLSSGFHTKHLGSLISQMGIQPYRCHCDGHCELSACIYKVQCSYIQVKRSRYLSTTAYAQRMFTPENRFIGAKCAWHAAALPHCRFHARRCPKPPPTRSGRAGNARSISPPARLQSAAQ